MHLSVTLANCAHWKDYVDSVRSCVADMLKDPTLNKGGQAGAYGMGAMVPNKNILKKMFYCYIESTLDI